jgi:hypothetical protein
VPPTPAGAVNPENNFVNYFKCADGDFCETGFPVQSAGDNPTQAYDMIKRIFAKSYGTWKWGGDKYVKTDYNWSPPIQICTGPALTRPTYPADFCGVPPTVANLQINKKTSDIVIKKSGTVNLTFNAMLDSQQLPLVMYSANWGDNNSDTVSGIEMMPKMATDDPHSLYYLYDYWDLKAKHSVNNGAGLNTVYCGVVNQKTATNYNNDSITITATTTADFCAVKPRVKLKDNWGWCTRSNGNTTSCPDTNDYIAYPNYIVVTEK